MLFPLSHLRKFVGLNSKLYGFLHPLSLCSGSSRGFNKRDLGKTVNTSLLDAALGMLDLGYCCESLTLTCRLLCRAPTSTPRPHQCSLSRTAGCSSLLSGILCPWTSIKGRFSYLGNRSRNDFERGSDFDTHGPYLKFFLGNNLISFLKKL